jgi:hypothetical protein
MLTIFYKHGKTSILNYGVMEKSHCREKVLSGLRLKRNGKHKLKPADRPGRQSIPFNLQISLAAGRIWAY